MCEIKMISNFVSDNKFLFSPHQKLKCNMYEIINIINIIQGFVRKLLATISGQTKVQPQEIQM